MNNWNGIGRLVKDPELRYTPSGVAICTFTIAVDRQFTNQQGEREADFIPVVCYRALAELCSNYISKGAQVGITGSLRTRSFDNKEGKRVYTWEIVAENVKFLSPKKDGIQTQGNRVNDPFAGAQTIDIKDDDLPF